MPQMSGADLAKEILRARRLPVAERLQETPRGLTQRHFILDEQDVFATAGGRSLRCACEQRRGGEFVRFAHLR